MRISLISVLILFACSSCVKDTVKPTRECSTVVKYWGIQCETQLPLLKFADGSFGEVSNPDQFAGFFSPTTPPDSGTSILIGWEYDEDVSDIPLPFILCNVGRTPADYIQVLCLETVPD